MFALRKIEKKSADWYVVELVNSAGDLIENVSINRISKKGDVFPNFDNLKQDTKIDGRLWESPANKMYLFAPKGGAKAPVKQAAATSASNSSYNASEEAEYPMHEKLETILNKQVSHTLKLDKILELLQPKKAVNDYPDDEETDSGIPF